MNTRGFTKVEVIITFVLVAILLIVVWMTVNPLEKKATERDNIRRSHVVAILNAVLNNKENGALPAGIDFDEDTVQVVGTTADACDLSCGAKKAHASCIDLTQYMEHSSMGAVPFDPKSGTGLNTDYYINRTEKGRLVVGACDPEISKSISVTR